MIAFGEPFHPAPPPAGCQDPAAEREIVSLCHFENSHASEPPNKKGLSPGPGKTQQLISRDSHQLCLFVGISAYGQPAFWGLNPKRRHR
jgi:hypothetical protein